MVKNGFFDMPLKSGRLTRKESTFVGVMAATGDATYAATKAGYSSPQARGSQNMSNQAISAAVRARSVARLHNDLLPKSLDVVDYALTAALVPIKDRLQAAKLVMTHVLGDKAESAGKAPSEMTPDELGAAIDGLKREMAERARPIIDADPIDDESEEDIPNSSVFE